MVDETFLRAQAKRCSELSRQCFDLTVAEQLRILGKTFDAKARDLERASAHRFRFLKWSDVARFFERMRRLPDRLAW